MMRARPGMTLMELVIALTILALVATMGGEAFATLIDRQATIRTASADVERAAALRDTLKGLRTRELGLGGPPANG